MQSDFYRIQRDSQDFCNLIVSEPFELTEHESRSIGLWEAVNKILNAVVHFLPKNLSLNQRRLFPRPGIPVIQLGFTSKSLQCLAYFHENLLSQVFSLIFTNHAEQITVNPRSKGCMDLLKL